MQRKTDFVKLLADLLLSGFTLQESLTFMKKVLPREKEVLVNIALNLSQGEELGDCFKAVGFAENYVAQLHLAQIHGDLAGTLKQIGRHLQDRDKQRQQIIKVLAYPLMLLVFLLGTILLMKWLLLPQLRQLQGGVDLGDTTFWLIEYGPKLVLLVVSVCVFFSVCLNYYFQKKTALTKSSFLMRIPLVNQFLRLVYTSFFANEWGKLLNQGLEMKELLVVMQGPGNTKLMSEVAVSLAKALENGQPIAQKISRWSFFQPELSLIIKQGEAKGRLGDELLIYSQRLWELQNRKMERLLTWVQPLIFILVAGLIIAVYSSLLLPIYKGMDGLL